MSNSERQIGAVKIVEGNAKSSNKNDRADDPFECRISSFSSINYHNFSGSLSNSRNDIEQALCLSRNFPNYICNLLKQSELIFAFDYASNQQSRVVQMTA